MKKVYIIFDIGKTNKKYFLFDENYNILEQESIKFKEINDDDGYPCDDLAAICEWIKASVSKVLANDMYEVLGLNFSTYGASLVHIDSNGKVVTPFYNYLKPLDEKVSKSFFDKYGPKSDFEFLTGSPSNDCLLNSGMQLYWLKTMKPEIFDQICHSLHFPQYLSYLFTSEVWAEYTSVGCHTALWDYTNGHCHKWIKENGMNHLLPIVKPTNQKYSVTIDDKNVEIGIGIHDSSAALVPYLQLSNEPFILLSTGTWSVSLNPFFEGMLSAEDVEKGCLNYLRPDGKVVRAGRIMLGEEYATQVEKLSKIYNKDNNYHTSLMFDKELFLSAVAQSESYFKFKYIDSNKEVTGKISHFSSFDQAYTQLMFELVKAQEESLIIAKGDSNINRIYVDGGFIDNDIFLKILASQLSQFEIYASSMPNGSALGALLIMEDKKDITVLNNQLRLILPNK